MAFRKNKPNLKKFLNVFCNQANKQTGVPGDLTPD